MNVSVFSAGLGRVEISRLCRFLNSVPGPFRFQAEAPLARLGDPDLHGYGYSDAAFLRLLENRRDDRDVAVIITGVPIEDNFFTRSIGERLIVTTFYQSDELLQLSGRTVEEYAAMAICAELVSIVFQSASGEHWLRLFHQDPRGCLFDFSGIKSQKLAKLTACSICDECLGTLDKHNVDGKVKAYAGGLLGKIRRPSIRTAMQMCVTAPGLSFVYGGLLVGCAVNLYSTFVMTQAPIGSTQRNALLIAGAAVLLFPLAVLAFLHLRSIRRRLR
jgi:hypothetical protein